METNLHDRYLFHTKTQEPYSILLNRIEWLVRREAILARDGYRCVKCGACEDDNTILQVHHKRYVFGKDPWEYDDSDLVTLCDECHSYIHSTSEVPIFGPKGDDISEFHLTKCSRCGGNGWIQKYLHVANGICFRCHGVMYDEFIDNVENYAIANGINVSDIDYGYRTIIGNEKEFNEFFKIDYPDYKDYPFKILPNMVVSLFRSNVIDGNRAVILDEELCNKEKKYAELVFDDGRIIAIQLDNPDNFDIGEDLDIHKLLYRISIRKSDRKFFITVKGAKIIEPIDLVKFYM